MIYFGTDGIRGKAYETLPLLRAYQLGVAIHNNYPNEKVIIGYDTRVSSYDFLEALIQGLNRQHSVVAGMVPTPAIAYLSMKEHAIGIMITASHNPYFDNGLKVFKYGFKLLENDMLALEKDMIKITAFDKEEVSIHESTIVDQYVHFAMSLPYLQTFEDYVIDAAHGATSILSKQLFKGHVYYDAPNGENINESCGATDLSGLQKVIGKHKVGFAFDGDGDRMLMIMDDRIIYGDEILYVFARDMVMQGVTPKVCLSVMTNPGILNAMEALGVSVYETPVGDRYLYEAIQAGHAEMGAEASGHYMLKYHNGVETVLIGDGMLAAKKMIDLLSRYGYALIKKWLEDITLQPMKTVSVMMDKKVLEHPSVKTCLEHIMTSIQKSDKLIIRPSGTEPKIRITVSMKDKFEMDKTIESILSCLKGGTS